MFFQQLPYPAATDNNGEGSHNVVDETEVDEAELELPPPMKPIQASQDRRALFKIEKRVFIALYIYLVVPAFLVL